jgi:hypothetical protein
MLRTSTQEEMRRGFAAGKPCGFGFTDKSSVAICPNGSVWIYEPILKKAGPFGERFARAKTWLDENEKTISRILDEAGNRGWIAPKKEMIIRHFMTADVTGDPAMTDNVGAVKLG